MFLILADRNGELYREVFCAAAESAPAALRPRSLGLNSVCRSVAPERRAPAHRLGPIVDAGRASCHRSTNLHTLYHARSAARHSNDRDCIAKGPRGGTRC